MILGRTQLEQREAAALGPWALQSALSAGRQYPEDAPAHRTAFQRDRDRIIHSAAFRRLQYKTQVFVNDAGDYFRTRLTHTLEMSQIGRALARSLAASEDLVEAICLAHDLGHPPFGHVGEETLDRLAGSFGGFDHNWQGWRLVTKLERRFRDWPGLNLTLETLEGMLRHETERNLAAEAGFRPELRGSLEAQIANISDDLAYHAHDLDDGLQSGLLRAEALEELEIWRLLGDRIGWRGNRQDEMFRHLLVRELIGLQVEDVLQETGMRLQAVVPATSMAVQLQAGNVVRHSESVLSMNCELGAFLHQHLYQHQSLGPVARRAEDSLEVIFRRYMARPELLPGPWLGRLANGEQGRVVVDFIADMTDRSALQTVARLTGSG